MAVIEDFEDITTDGWDSQGAGPGTVISQDVIAIVGKALEIESTGGFRGRSKDFTVTGYGIYARTQLDFTGFSGARVQVRTTAGADILLVSLGQDGTDNFFYFDTDNWHDTTEAIAANTWYWFGFERVDTTHGNIHCWNEAKTVEIFSYSNLTTKNDWPASSEMHIGTEGSETVYYDELTDDGTPPTPPSAQFMVTKKYW